MSKPSGQNVIRLRGVRHNNLKNFDLDLPLNQLIVITGLSGSGKSSLAFDTLFAEGQRRYIETFSPYARQFFDRMDKPQVDSIDGIPPAIAIEQRNAVKTTRSTVGTMTEICDYMKMLWPHIAQLYCRQCGRPVRKDSPQRIWEKMLSAEGGTRNAELLITFDLPLTEKLSLEESLNLVTKQGYQRLLLPVGEAFVRVASDPQLELNEAAAPWDGPDPPPAPSGERTPRTLNAHCPLEPQEAPSPLPSPPVGEREGVRGVRERSENTRAVRQFPSWEGSGAGSPSATAARAVDFEIARIDQAMERLGALKPRSLTVIQDRIKLSVANRARFVEACEQAYHFGKGKLAVRLGDPKSDSTIQRFNELTFHFSNRFHCAQCDIEYREPSPALFSFNHPLGACPTCRGFGRTISIDYNLALPDRSKTLAEGVVKPWRSGHGVECQQDLMKFCKIRKAPTDLPFDQLSIKWQDWVINGDPDYGKDAGHEWPRAWYGVKGYFRWLESKAYKMHVRVLLSRYRSYAPCPDCRGKRFQPEALLYRLPIDDLRFTGSENSTGAASIVNRQSQITLADFYQLPIRDALRFIEQTAAQHRPATSDPIGLVLNEVRSRLGYLVEVGLGYLTLDRPTRTLSGGETERVNLTTCLGTRLVNTLYVLDEPSVGLHPRDTGRLIKILERLRDVGNTVVVVEHEAGVIRAANRIVDLGPGHGESGGHVVFQGAYSEILKSRGSLTGQYLSGGRQIEIPQRRPVAADVRRLISKSEILPRDGTQSEIEQSLLTSAATNGCLTVGAACLHNLKNISVEIPLNRFVCVTGVSGSGKTTLVREALLPALEAKLKSQIANLKSAKTADPIEEEHDNDDSPSTINLQPSTTLTGWERLGRVVLVDQSTLGKTPRSNPAVYIGAFDDLRELFAQTDAAKQRGLSASAFSFNSAQGQCERCRGTGFEKIEMQFLSDVFIRCPDCDGRRYRPHILEVKVRCPSSVVSGKKSGRKKATDNGLQTTDKDWSIADLLEATVDEVVDFLAAFSESRPAQRAAEKLKLLQEVGLGYLRLGQPINTLSGGESQRLKLVSHLAETAVTNPKTENLKPKEIRNAKSEISSVASGTRSSDFGIHSDFGFRTSDLKGTLFLFDEPTTGLHFDDVRLLLKVFQRLVDAGHSVLVIEHNLDVIKCADWVIDLGPEAGDEGGQIVATGTPEHIVACEASYTGRALKGNGLLALTWFG